MTDTVQQQITWLLCFDDGEADRIGAARCANTMQSQQTRIEKLEGDLALFTVESDRLQLQSNNAEDRNELLEKVLEAAKKHRVRDQSGELRRAIVDCDQTKADEKGR